MNRCPRCGAPSAAARCLRCGAALDPVTRPLALHPAGPRPAPMWAGPYAAAPPPRQSGGLVLGAIAVLLVVLAALGLGLLRPDLVGLAGGSPFAAAGEAAPGSSVGTTPAAGTSGTVAPVAGESADPDPAAALRQQAAADRADLLAVEGSWVPQLSSKRPGTVDGGRTYDAAAILAEHESLRAAHPQARLLWSGDWSVFSADDYWVTVLAQPSSSAADANAWCDAQGFGADDCLAKRLSRTGGSAGTAVHR